MNNDKVNMEKANIVAFKNLRKLKDDVKQNKINKEETIINLDIKIENELKEKINKIIENINSDTDSDIGVSFLLDVIKSNLFTEYVSNSQCLNEFKSFRTKKGLGGIKLSSNSGLSGYFGLLQYLNEAQHRIISNISNNNTQNISNKTNSEENHMYKGVYYGSLTEVRNLKEAEKERKKQNRIMKTTKKLDIVDPNTREIIE
jgi:hypothetical protein